MSACPASGLRKRARTDDSSEDEKPGPDDVKARAVEGGLLPSTRDAEFWFDDGTVILVAGDVEFRVYSGILAHHSPILKDLISDPASTRLLPIHNQSELRCPVVRLSDSPDDLRHLLRAYMPQDASNIYDYKTPSFSAVSASIRLGHKYQIASLYDQALQLLRSNFPDNYDTFDDLEGWLPTGWMLEDAIGVVNLARLIGDPTLLPVALLVCTRLGEQVVRGYDRDNGTQEYLTIDDQALCIRAMTEIHKARVAVLFRTLCPTASKTCKTAVNCKSALRKAVYSLHSTIDDWLGHDDNPFDDYTVYLKDQKLDVCDMCLSMIDAQSVAERRKMWNRLPLLLGIQVPGWGAPAPPQPGPAQQ